MDLPYEEAVAKDGELWKLVTPGKLYWFPGTRIAGAISLGDGGTNCPPAKAPPASYLTGSCKEHNILDDHGHGTMTASRAAGAPNSLAPNARIVEIEGLGGRSVRWAADQGWIDVQSNSWLSFVPGPLDTNTAGAFAHASERTFTLAASGNGTAFIAGVAPTPTYALSTAPPGVVLVGGHDNGKMTLWAGSPPHVVADAYAGETALAGSDEPMRPDPIACCTSAASPYAAGGATAIVIEARRILRDTRTGVRDGVVARGRPCRVKKGPLVDGEFTLEELRELYFHTAEAHPGEGRDDGEIHWMGAPRAPDHLEYGLGGNPFCAGCTTTPIAWSSVPAGVDAYPQVGYGAINERSVALAFDVLRGKADSPERVSGDEQYAADQALRALLFERKVPDLQSLGSREELSGCEVVVKAEKDH